MKLGVLRTGVVGRSIGGRLAVLDHDVTIGTRDVAAILASSEPNHITHETFADWHAKNNGVGLGSFAEAAEHFGSPSIGPATYWSFGARSSGPDVPLGFPGARHAAGRGQPPDGGHEVRLLGMSTEPDQPPRFLLART
jgi:hypothetical protein